MITRRFEMACTDRDFERGVKLAFPEAVADPAERCWRGAGWVLRLGSPGERHLAGLRLPAVQAEFSFADDRPEHAEAVLHRFWLVFQRGGG